MVMELCHGQMVLNIVVIGLIIMLVVTVNSCILTIRTKVCGLTIKPTVKVNTLTRRVQSIAAIGKTISNTAKVLKSGQKVHHTKVTT